MSSFFKVLLDVFFYITCLALVAVVAVTAMAVRGGTGKISMSLPVSFAIDPTAYQIQGESALGVNARIEEATGKLRVNRPTMAGELMQAGFQYFGQAALTVGLSSPQTSFHPGFAPSGTVILSGLALLTVAEIFREGIKMRTDLETARAIQTSLVAAQASSHGPVSIQARMHPAAEVGGDYYDVIDLGSGRLAFVVADVAGKGLPAALLMTLLRGSLRSLLSAGLRGTALMSALNTHLLANTPDNRMITCFYGELDIATGRLIYINAGHDPPYLCEGDQRRPLDSTAVVLGVLDGMPFPEASAELGPASRLVLYTDGISETEHTAGEQFGVERLEAAISGPGTSETARTLDTIMAAVERFQGAARQSDDMTMMLVSRERAA